MFLNYGWGSVGSQFTLTGFGFAPNGSVRLGANGTQLVGSLSVNASGSFITVLDTSTADAGYYLVSADSVLSAAAQMALSTASLMLDNNSPLRPQEGGGVPLTQIPAGIAADPHLLYLPQQMK